MLHIPPATGGKENESPLFSSSSDAAKTTTKTTQNKNKHAAAVSPPHTTSTSSTMPTLFLEGFHPPPLLDFGAVAAGEGRALTFSIVGGSRKLFSLDVDRAPEAVTITLGEKTGHILWQPSRTQSGKMREVVLLQYNKRHRLQMTLTGVAIPKGLPLQLRAAQNSQDVSFMDEAPPPSRQSLSAPNSPGGRGRRRRDQEEQGEREVTAPRGRALSRCIEDGQAAFRAASAGLLTEGRGHHNIVSHTHTTQGPQEREEKVLMGWLNFVLAGGGEVSDQQQQQSCAFLQMEEDEAKARFRALFESDKIKTVRLGIMKEIAQKRLQVREDKNLMQDLTLREDFLDLLLSYDLPYLQAGLEAVLQIDIDKTRVVKSRDGQLLRVPTLNLVKKVLTARVLSDPSILATHAGRPSNMVKEAMQLELQSHTIQRFLELVVLLDQAKHLNLLPRRRALFKPTAPSKIKSSAEMLFAFAKHYLAAAGSLVKQVAHLGYEVSFKQSFLQEVDFRVKALSSDLRDGVRLARLVELIESDVAGAGAGIGGAMNSSNTSNNKTTTTTNNNNTRLTRQLRVPAISRLQKIHNCKVVLEAVKTRAAAGNHRIDRLQLQRLRPEDLVDGHREKTLSFLWAIVRTHNLAALVASLTGITRLQSLVRMWIIRRRFLLLKNLAVALQRLYRSRQTFFRCRHFPTTGAVALQGLWRGAQVRNHMAQLHAAALILQSAVRVHRAKQQRARLLGAVLVLRTFISTHLHRRRSHALLAAVIMAQKLLRGQRARRQVQTMNQVRQYAMATKIIQLWRGHKVRVQVQHWHAQALCIQAVCRGHRCHKDFGKLKRGLVQLQACLRGAAVRRQLAVQQTAAVKLQRLWRGHQAKMQFRAHVWAVVRVQSLLRGYLEKQRYQQSLQRIVLLQANLRGSLVRRQLRLDTLAATKLQAFYRAWCAHQRWRKIRAAVVAMQALARARTARQRAQTCALAVLTLQKHLRGTLTRKHLQQQQEAAFKIQAVWRGHHLRWQMVTVARGALQLQALVRGHRARQFAQMHWNALLLIQRAARRFVQQKQCKTLGAALEIQRHWRAFVVRKQMKQQVQASILLQAAWRCGHARRVFVAGREAVIKVQSLTRRWLAMRVSEEMHHERLVAALKIQSMWRGFVVRQQLAQQVQAAIYVQTAWRRAHTRRAFVAKREAVIQLQALVRGWLSLRSFHIMQHERLVAGIEIQSLWRGFVVRQQFAQQVQAAIRVQACWRCANVRRAFVAEREAVIQLQSLTRRWLALRRFRTCVTGICAFQRLYRRHRLLRRLQHHRAAVVKAQSLWRGCSTRNAYTKKQQAILCLQTWTRFILSRHRQRRFQRSVLLLQALLRGWLVRRVSLPKVRALRARVHESEARAKADPSLRIGVRHAAALEVLLSSKSCSQILKCCMTLEVSTSLARECCEALVEVEGIPKLLAVIRSCNRSQPHIQLLRHVLRVLDHVTKHKTLLGALANADGASETLVELLQTYRPEDLTFVPAGRLLLRAVAYQGEGGDGGEGNAASVTRRDLQTNANVQRKLQGSLRLLERKAEVEKGKKTNKMHKARDNEVSVMGAVKVLRLLVNYTHVEGKEN